MTTITRRSDGDDPQAPSHAHPPLPRRGHISDRRLVQVQAISGLVFSGFLSVHLLAVMVSPFGAGQYDRLQQATRPLYQHPVVELLGLLAPLAVHIAAGILRMRHRPRAFTTHGLPWRTKLHRVSGWFLLTFVGGHALATRGPSWWADIWPGFAGLSFTVSAFPAYFYPYYMLLGAAGLVHAVYGIGIAGRILGGAAWSPTTYRRIMAAPLAVGVGLIVLGVLSFGGVFYPIDDPENNDFARLYRGFLESL